MCIKYTQVVIRNLENIIVDNNTILIIIVFCLFVNFPCLIVIMCLLSLWSSLCVYGLVCIYYAFTLCLQQLFFVCFTCLMCLILLYGSYLVFYFCESYYACLFSSCLGDIMCFSLLVCKFLYDCFPCLVDFICLLSLSNFQLALLLYCIYFSFLVAITFLFFPVCLSKKHDKKSNTTNILQIAKPAICY